MVLKHQFFSENIKMSFRFMLFLIGKFALFTDNIALKNRVLLFDFFNISKRE